MTNVKKLALHFASIRAIPVGGGIADGARWFLDPERMKQDIAAAEEEAQAAIQMVKAAKDNPYGDDDEAIAGELLRRIKKRKGARPGP